MNRNVKRLFVDMDGVLCKFNKEASIEEVAAEGYFTRCEPQQSVVNAVLRILYESCTEVFILSSVFSDNHSIPDKCRWLDEYGFSGIDDEHRLFVPYGTSKADYLKETVGAKNDDFLLDDFSKNLHEWHGIGIKLMNGINGTKGTWNGYNVSSRSTEEVIKNTLMGIMRYAHVA